MSGEPSPVLTSRWPDFDEQQIDAAIRVLRSGKTNYWSGSECRNFEAEFARFVGVRHAITLANGTVALELALKAIGVGPGDEVIVPSSSFVATASSVVACGAVPVFADIDPVTQTVSCDTLRTGLSPRTRAVIVVHLYGFPCLMDVITKWAREQNICVIEDCAQAHGARFRDQPVGSFGDMAAFSFCQDKIISTGGEGGMLLCQSGSAWEKAWSYKDHGKHPDSITAIPGAGYRWTHDSAGTNWRMTEFQAAIGRVQLRRLPEWVARRQQIADYFRDRLATIAVLRLPEPPAQSSPAWYRFPLQVRLDRLKLGWSRDRIVNELLAHGVPCGVGVCPELYLEGSMKQFAPAHRLPQASALSATGFCLTMHHNMTNTEIAHIADRVGAVLSESSRS